MQPGTVVEWHDGTRIRGHEVIHLTRRGRVLAQERPGVVTVEAEDGSRYVLPAGRLTAVET